MSTIVLSIAGALVAALLAAFVNWLRQPDWTRRHPGTVLCAVVALAVVGGVIGWWSEELRDRPGTGGGAAAGPGSGAGSPASSPAAPPTDTVPDTSPPLVPPDPARPNSVRPPAPTPSRGTGTGGDGGTGGGVDTGGGADGGRRSWTPFTDGRVQLPKVAGLELDADPAQPVSGASAGADLRYSNDEALGMKLYAGPAFAVWDDSGVPDAEACRRKLLSFPAYSDDPEPGRTYCVGTSDGRIARLRVERAGYDAVTFRATVWSGAN